MSDVDPFADLLGPIGPAPEENSENVSALPGPTLATARAEAKPTESEPTPAPFVAEAPAPMPMPPNMYVMPKEDAKIYVQAAVKAAVEEAVASTVGNLVARMRDVLVSALARVEAMEKEVQGLAKVVESLDAESLQATVNQRFSSVDEDLRDLSRSLQAMRDHADLLETQQALAKLQTEEKRKKKKDKERDRTRGDSDCTPQAADLGTGGGPAIAPAQSGPPATASAPCAPGPQQASDVNGASQQPLSAFDAARTMPNGPGQPSAPRAAMQADAASPFAPPSTASAGATSMQHSQQLPPPPVMPQAPPHPSGSGGYGHPYPGHHQLPQHPTAPHPAAYSAYGPAPMPQAQQMPAMGPPPPAAPPAPPAQPPPPFAGYPQQPGPPPGVFGQRSHMPPPASHRLFVPPQPQRQQPPSVSPAQQQQQQQQQTAQAQRPKEMSTASIVNDICQMGFPRHEVESALQREVAAGRSVDLNAVVDALMSQQQ